MFYLSVEDHQDGAPLWVELLWILHLLVSRTLWIKLGLAVEKRKFEQIFKRVETNSRPDVPLTISSMQVSLYIPMGQLYFGVFTWNNKQMITFHKENLWKTLKDEDDNFALSNYWKKRTNWRRLLIRKLGENMCKSGQQILRQHCFNHENGMDFMTNSIFANKMWYVCVCTRGFRF